MPIDGCFEDVLQQWLLFFDVNCRRPLRLLRGCLAAVAVIVLRRRLLPAQWWESLTGYYSRIPEEEEDITYNKLCLWIFILHSDSYYDALLQVKKMIERLYRFLLRTHLHTWVCKNELVIVVTGQLQYFVDALFLVCVSSASLQSCLGCFLFLACYYVTPWNMPRHRSASACLQYYGCVSVLWMLLVGRRGTLTCKKTWSAISKVHFWLTQHTLDKIGQLNQNIENSSSSECVCMWACVCVCLLLSCCCEMPPFCMCTVAEFVHEKRKTWWQLTEHTWHILMWHVVRNWER